MKRHRDATGCLQQSSLFGLFASILLSGFVVSGCDREPSIVEPVRVEMAQKSTSKQVAKEAAPLPSRQELAAAERRQAKAPPSARTRGASRAKPALPAGHPSIGAGAGQRPHGAGGKTLSGSLVESVQAGKYTYLKLATSAGDQWAAVPRTSRRKGIKITVQNAVEMKDFASKTLGRRFARIWFGTLDDVHAPGPSAGGGAGKTGQRGPVEVGKAVGEGAVTIAELYAGSAAMAGRTVRIRGRVVRYNEAILQRNWLHLQDGTGVTADKTHDITVTTSERARVGDVITVVGQVATDRDFGAGYRYPVIIEQARVQR